MSVDPISSKNNTNSTQGQNQGASAKNDYVAKLLEAKQKQLQDRLSQIRGTNKNQSPSTVESLQDKIKTISNLLNYQKNNTNPSDSSGPNIST